MTYIFLSEFTNATSHMHDYFAVKKSQKSIQSGFTPLPSSAPHVCSWMRSSCSPCSSRRGRFAHAVVAAGAVQCVRSLHQISIRSSSGANKLLLR